MSTWMLSGPELRAIEAMKRAIEYLEQHADTNDGAEGPVPNEAMALQTALHHALCELQGVKPW